MLILIVLLIVALAAVIYCRPADQGRPHNHYFQQLQSSLQTDGPGHPVLVLDLDRLDANIATSRAHFNQHKRFRIVAKSLPSLPLLQYICTQAGTHSIMAFHRPFLNLMIRHLPEADFLLGKPFPIQAAQRFFAALPETADAQASCERIQWLVDSLPRTEQYLQLARQRQLKLRLNIEIDVGLHRGGLRSTDQLKEVLTLIRDNADSLEFSGFMGYEPHIAKLPLGNAERIDKARQQAMAVYQRYIDCLREDFPALYHEQLTFNGAGSPTYQLYQHDDTLNDLCAGSSLVKPGDFDLQTLTGKQPALFIATPVLKKLPGTTIPFLEKLGPWLARYNRNWQASIFSYGGYWKASPCSPAGVRNNALYGRSSNQEMFTLSERTELDVDDYLFLRPNQSEAVMLEFSDLLVVRGGKIIDNWPLFNQSVTTDNIR